MSDPTSALQAALGYPPLGGYLPGARAPAWRHARILLQEHFRRLGLRTHIRSPAALWALLHPTNVPRGATWGQLITDCTLADLERTLRAPTIGQGARLASWNVRWMVSPHTAQNASKRATIRHWLDAGRLVLLQETHWDAADCAIWASAFPAATAYATPAGRGPRGGPQGGVAAIVPLGSPSRRPAR